MLLIGGLVGAYLWYQNPDKVVTDAIQKTNSTKIIKTKIKLGGLDLPSPSDDVNVSFDGLELEIAGDMNKMALDYSLTANLKLMGQKVPLKAKIMLVDKKDVYFYLEDVSKVVDGVIDGFGQSFGAELTTEFNKIRQQIKPLLAKVENQWVKVPLDELKKLVDDEDDNKVLTCMTNVIKNFDTNKHMDQTKAILKEHKFYQAGDVKTVDGDFAINIKIDKTKLKSYGEKMLETDFAKALVKCSETKIDQDDQDDYEDLDDYGEVDEDFDFDFDDDDYESIDQPEISKESAPSLKNAEFVISKWGHELKKVNLDLEAKTTKNGEPATQIVKLEATFDWPKSIDIKAPSGAVKFEDWIKSIEDEAKKLKSVFGGSDDDFLGINPLSSL